MKNVFLTVAATAAIAATSPAFASTVVNFDQSTDPTTYVSQGVQLTGFTILSNTFGGAVNTPSPPNYANIDYTGALINFVNPGTSIATTASNIGFTVPGLSLGGGYYAGGTATFLNAANQVLGTQSFAPVGPNEYRSPIVYMNNFTGVSSILFSRTENQNGPALFPIDNLTFTLASGGVPEPATWALMIIGFGAVGGSMRYRRKTSTVKFA